MSKESVHTEAMYARDYEDGMEMGPVSKKWQGTDADRHEMSMLGRVQELRVRATPTEFLEHQF